MDSRAFGEKVFRIVLALCGVVVLLDFFYTKHGHYGFEQWIGFHGAYGFVSCLVLVLVARGLRRALMRGEDYYD